MTLLELFDYVLVDSGQFLLGQGDIEMNETNFLRLVKQRLRTYSRQKPRTSRFNIEIPDRVHTFTGGAGNDEIPEFVSDVIPITHQGGSLYTLFQRREYYDDFRKFSFIWEYQKPTLIVQATGTFDVLCAYHRRITKVEAAGNVDAYWDLEDITDDDDVFIKLVLGHFMQGIGRSRTAFTHQELPVANSGAELINEGKEIIDEAKEELFERASFHLGWG